MDQDQDILREVTARVTLPPRYCLYLYGSFVVHPETARDIDVVMISSDLSEVGRMSFPLGDGANSKPCNLYCVPQVWFEADCRTLAYGGFYAHKFAFYFDLLAQSEGVANAGEYYWRSQVSRLTWDVGIDVSELITRIHREMYECNPTVARSLSKYLTSPVAQGRLNSFVRGAIGRRPMEVAAINRHEWQVACQMVMYRFWHEYQRARDGRLGWSEIVREKMSASLIEADSDLIREYLFGSR